LRSSNTCHNRARNSFGSAWLPALAIATCFSPVLRGLDPDDSISRYIHDQWSEEDGFPGGTVNAITQTRDGYLWIGGEGGLVRFDGNVFTRIGSVAEPVLGLIADHEGALWIRTEAGGLIRYSGGTLKRDFFATGPNPVVTAMGLGRQGTPLLVRFGEPMRFEGGKLIDLSPRPVDATTRLTTSTAETPDGTVWMGSRDSGLFALRGTVLSPLGGLPDSKVNCLLAGPGSELWVGTDKGLVLWNGQKLTRSVPPSVQHAEILALARDRDANVWVGTSTGLVRIDSRNVAADDGARGGVNAVFEDREGNLWIGRGGGIERYRESVFLTYAHQPHAADNGPLYVDASGRAWFAPPEGGLAWLTGLDQGIVTQAGLDKDVVYSMDGGPGEVWAGRQRGGLTELRVKNGVFAVRTYTQADGLARGSVFAVRRTRNGTIWAGTLDGGVSRLRNGRLTTYTRSDGLLSDTVYAIEEGADGTVWFATPNGLESFANDRWQTHAFAEGLPPGRVNCLTWDPAGVLWIGTEAGVAFVRDGRMQMARNPPVSLIADVLGIAVDERAYLWIATNKSVMRVPRGRLLGQRAATDEILPRGRDTFFRRSEAESFRCHRPAGPDLVLAAQRHFGCESGAGCRRIGAGNHAHPRRGRRRSTPRSFPPAAHSRRPAENHHRLRRPQSFRAESGAVPLPSRRFRSHLERANNDTAGSLHQSAARLLPLSRDREQQRRGVEQFGSSGEHRDCSGVLADSVV